MFKISSHTRSLIRQALREDIGGRDLTTDAFVPSSLTAEAYITVKGKGVLSGGPVVREVFRCVDPGLRLEQLVRDGAQVAPGRKVFKIRGRAASILKGERVALNFLGRLSGIATLTHQFVRQVRGTRADILDTRKTTPLWRELEKYAVRSGGGQSHRSGLWDGVLVKDNHWIALRPVLERKGCRYFERRLAELARSMRGRKKKIIQVEVQSIKGLKHLLETSFCPPLILLDNFSVSELKRAVEIVHHRLTIPRLLT